MKKFIVSLIIICIMMQFSFGWVKYYVENATTTSGSKTVVLGDYSTAKKSLTIYTSGTVNMTIVIYEDNEEVAIKTLTLTTASKWKYVTTHRIDQLKITWTITTGTLEKIVLKCN